MEIIRGEVYHADLEPRKGSEMGKSHRPCLIVSCDAINKSASVIIICPITDSYNKRESPIHIKIPKGEAGLEKDSIVHCGQVRAIDKVRLGSRAGVLNTNFMDYVNKGLIHSLGL